MQYILDLIETGDVCALVFLAAIFIYIGQWMASSSPTLQLWGWRVATASFLGYLIYGFAMFATPAADELVTITLRALLAGALALGPAWIVLSVLSFTLHRLSTLQSAAARLRSHRPPVFTQPEPPIHPIQNTETPEQQAARLKVQQRRQDARFASESLYSLYAIDIAERFSKSEFDSFLKKYMGDDQSPETVEQRAGRLQQMIQQHYEKVNPPEDFPDLEALTNWYEAQKMRIETLPIQDSYKQDYLVQLNTRYADLTQQIMERLKP